jgi:hypothetical protein
VVSRQLGVDRDAGLVVDALRKRTPQGAGFEVGRYGQTGCFQNGGRHVEHLHQFVARARFDLQVFRPEQQRHAQQPAFTDLNLNALDRAIKTRPLLNRRQTASVGLGRADRF